jgi:C4-dicarboxylate-specific signal transduction histidine kinase
MRGGPERRLSLTVTDGHGTATLTVRDTGPGVPPDVLPRIFAPFFTTKSHGTGLGLAIAQRMVEGLSGRITAERPPEGGMCFRIELPTAGTPDVAGSAAPPYAARR